MSGPTGALGMGATLIGGIFKTVGDYAALGAKGAVYGSEADAAYKAAAAYGTAAEATDYAGLRNVQYTGMQWRAALGRAAVARAAGNVAGRSVTDVQSSQIALAQQSERESMARSQELSYLERTKGAMEAYRGGQYKAAQAAIGPERELTLIGDITTAVGGTATVADKWYQVSGTPGGDMGGTPNYPLQGPEGETEFTGGP